MEIKRKMISRKEMMMKMKSTCMIAGLSVCLLLTGCAAKPASVDGDGVKYAQNSVNNPIDETLDASKATVVYSTRPYVEEKKNFVVIDFACVDPDHTMIEFGTFFADSQESDTALTELDARSMENVYNVVAGASPSVLYTAIFDDDRLLFVDQSMSNDEIEKQKEAGYPDALYIMQLGDTREEFLKSTEE